MEYRSANEAPSLEQLVQHAKHLAGESIHDDIVASIYRSSHSICETVVSYKDREMLRRSEKLDNIFHISYLGIPDYACHAFCYFFT
ncbi:hypothetical protein GCM10020331_082400 [Ectobacillus funiculus]